jgi:Arc/MetJ-type ribon-helix-helix transcriptional regulator
MALISLTLDQKEESMVDFLSEYYEQDKSSLIKYSIRELYDDIMDKQAIAEYEAKEKNGRVKFIDSAEVLSMLQNQKL